MYGYVHDLCSWLLVQVKRLHNKLMYYIFCIVTGKTATLHYRLYKKLKSRQVNKVKWKVQICSAYISQPTTTTTFGQMQLINYLHWGSN